MTRSTKKTIGFLGALVALTLAAVALSSSTAPTAVAGMSAIPVQGVATL